MISALERQRYQRQIGIKEVGEEGQERLKAAKVLVAGAGGLGSASLPYLVAAGFGAIRIIDQDLVELSNLNRQILHWTEDIGRPKTASAMDKLGRLNPEVDMEAIQEKITNKNADALVGDYDLIVDALDNLSTRYILNRVAIEKGIPFFHGAVSGFEGRAMTIIPGRTACLHCFYRGRLKGKKTPVIGVTPAIIGIIQATEVIKYVLGTGKLLTNTLMVYDGLSATFNKFKINRDPNCKACGHLSS